MVEALRSAIAKAVFTMVTLAVVITNIVFLALDGLVPSMKDLPKGEFLTSTAAQSLNTPYVLSFYRVNVGGRLGTALRAEATELSSGKTYNVYWELDAKDTPLYSWVSDYQIIVNGHAIELNEDGVHFDSRTYVPVAE